MKCNECKTNLLELSREWMVMIDDEVWLQICKFFQELICDKCIEKRLGRKLILEDLRNIQIGPFKHEKVLCNEYYILENF